jgi:hypothetical protein
MGLPRSVLHQSRAPFHGVVSGAANVMTGSEMNVGDDHFELKPVLVNMVQHNPFCEKALEDSNAHLQHSVEICNTFTIQGVIQNVIHLCLFPFSLLRMVM